MNAHRRMGTAVRGQNKSIEKLSSGQRINRAGDDAAGLAISEKMRGQIRGLNQASRNAQDGISLVQTAEGALDETSAMLQRMKELAVQSANDTNSTAQRGHLQKEVDELISAIGDIATKTKFNDKSLLDNTDTLQIHTGANTGDALSITLGDMQAAAIGVDALKIDTQADANTALTTIDTAIDKVSTQRAQFGAKQNRLEHTIKSIDNTSENLQAAESRIRDTDMAKEMMNMTRLNILQQSSQAMLSQANQQPQSVLQLLR
jgi:flagellin